TGAVPVFADCTPDTWQVDPVSIKKNISSRTRLVVGVHLYGQPCNVDEIKEICAQNGLIFLEDAAQAHGAHYKNIRVGTFGEMACFSFYPGKNLGACGEAGAIVTNTEKYDARLRSLRNHGSQVRYYHDELGYNMRMSGFEAASLHVKLQYLESWNERRREIASIYQAEIHNSKITFQFQPLWAASVYHLFVITTENRNELIKYLNEFNIYPGLHYPVPCHLQKVYSALNYKEGDCPNAEYLASHCLSLPMYAELEDEQLDFIIDLLNQY
ncbi:MAG TPA: DegT/DnrJ/EryC1/StrS family aminotransferase, partial [Flavisolibacter sp.]|nr:DegT/DnrJ/EryC1/StrS family aminotransferase [Flavisolibacter sp.]